MLSKNDVAEISKMINEAKKDLRNEFRNNSNTHSTTEVETKSDVNDNTEAILELSEIIGG